MHSFLRVLLHLQRHVLLALPGVSGPSINFWPPRGQGSEIFIALTTASIILTGIPCARIRGRRGGRLGERQLV